jgi:hypothetical protein
MSRPFVNSMRVLYGSVGHLLFWLFTFWFNVNRYNWIKLCNFWVKKPMKLGNHLQFRMLASVSRQMTMHDRVITWTVRLQHRLLSIPHGRELRDMCLGEHQCQVCVWLVHIFLGVSFCLMLIPVHRTLLLFCKLLLLKAVHYWKIFCDTFFNIYSMNYTLIVSYSM